MTLPIRNEHKVVRENWRGTDLIMRYIQNASDEGGGGPPSLTKYYLTRAFEPIVNRLGENWVWR